ncbi:hypothetical protein DKM44_02580 [Deinococcus irradiatisoli]|uniref:IrrE N-terminal-like domain-containing protein n=1 Tax=Deinococcus irradiatisoli TaxID=2202254 RepID=A0A2Z3JH35_9DEIO|nr:ImmA/IrrE family metallo-endopeptidase [Deinococcus irradiatisoli]AWN22259.1 hypothetical protein DKM44_02580 [Deinococcus irradiatisoli]
MDLDYLFHYFTQHVERVHAAHGYLSDVRRLASELGIRMRPGLHNSLVWGDPPLITLSAEDYGSRRQFSAMHEVAHLLLKECGAESELLLYFGDLEEAAPAIEGWCNHAAGLLLLPRPLLQAAEAEHGLSAATVLSLQRSGQVSLGAALRRVVYAEPDRRLAAFASTAGRRVSDIAKLNFSVPFWRHDRLPESIPRAAAQQKTFALGEGSEVRGSCLRVPGRGALGLLVAP